MLSALRPCSSSIDGVPSWRFPSAWCMSCCSPYFSVSPVADAATYGCRCICRKTHPFVISHVYRYTRFAVTHNCPYTPFVSRVCHDTTHVCRYARLSLHTFAKSRASNVTIVCRCNVCRYTRLSCCPRRRRDYGHWQRVQLLRVQLRRPIRRARGSEQRFGFLHRTGVRPCRSLARAGHGTRAARQARTPLPRVVLAVGTGQLSGVHHVHQHNTSSSLAFSQPYNDPSVVPGVAPRSVVFSVSRRAMKAMQAMKALTMFGEKNPGHVLHVAARVKGTLH